MDHESYEDPVIAEFLNENWICIKVDRDERPDVDARYQRAVQALTGQGGWPLTAFLTADGAVFYGGTYFPPDGKFGRPGFRSVLTSLARLYHEKPTQVLEQAQQIADHISGARSDALPGTLDTDLLARAATAMAHPFDRQNGGFGSQPKFPHPGACDFLLTRWFDTGETPHAEMTHRTLEAMAHGGIRDHLGGGFHRYSVDARWIVPHFEKMLYDNAELLKAYVNGAAALAAPQTGSLLTVRNGDSLEPLYRTVINGVVRWILEVMSDPRGGYCASQDADVGPEDDGDYFTWTPDEARAVLSAEEFEVLARRYDIEQVGEMHHNRQKNVLWVKQSVEQIAAALGRSAPDTVALLTAGEQKLKSARDSRQTPFVDTTVYTAWSAMMASAMLAAAAFLDRSDVEHHALATLDRLFDEAAEPDLTGGIRHAIGSSVRGILDDQVQSASASLDAFEATGEHRWLDRAIRLMEHVWSDYRTASGGLADVAIGRGGEGFLTQELTPIHDSPTPSPNGIAGIVLARLAEHTGERSWATRCDALLSAVAGAAAELSIFGATLLRAIDWSVMPTTHVVVVGQDDRQTRELLRTARSTYRPRKVIRWITPGAPTTPLPKAIRAMLDGAAPRVYVCAGTQCAPPAATVEQVTSALTSFGRT
jgi:uncharacterized protein YyaL (SSP411 family)